MARAIVASIVFSVSWVKSGDGSPARPRTEPYQERVAEVQLRL